MKYRLGILNMFIMLRDILFIAEHTETYPILMSYPFEKVVSHFKLSDCSGRLFMSNICSMVLFNYTLNTTINSKAVTIAFS